jgi:uncharacterized membrane protein YphA (DoxX/SURF4 family)
MFKKKIITNILIVYISFVFIQSLFFKFSGAPETQYIFNTIDAWATDSFGLSGLFVPPGIFNAYVIASAELVASIMLLIGMFTSRKFLIPVGALLAFGIINGAIFFHLFTPLGINVQDDGGALFTMACGVWVSSLILILIYKNVALQLLCCKKTTAS